MTETELGGQGPTLGWRVQAAIVVLVVALGAGAATAWTAGHRAKAQVIETESLDAIKRGNRAYRPKDAEWSTLTIQTVEPHAFTAEQATEGKVQVNEDRSTPIFSPYAGRVTKLLAKAGDRIERGQLLFVVEATDMVQAQNDFIGAVTAMNKARSALDLAKISDKRNRDLYEAKAVPLKEMQQAQGALIAAQNDMRSADTALEAARNRLRILGRSDEDITAFQETGRINPDTPVYAPISGTIVQRKIGPGQYVGAGSSDPVFVVGDLSTVWLTAYVRETDVAKIGLGQEMSFSVLAYPDKVFRSTVDYVAAAIDPASRRLMVRATVDNAEGLLKPEMFANVTIATNRDVISPAAPREALIWEGSAVRAWVARDDHSIELRDVTVGMTDGRLMQVKSGLQSGEKIVVRGTLFIDRLASGN